MPSALLPAGGGVDAGEGEHVGHAVASGGVGHRERGAPVGVGREVRVGVELEEAEEHFGDDAAADGSEMVAVGRPAPGVTRTLACRGR